VEWIELTGGRQSASAEAIARLDGTVGGLASQINERNAVDGRKVALAAETLEKRPNVRSGRSEVLTAKEDRAALNEVVVIVDFLDFLEFGGVVDFIVRFNGRHRADVAGLQPRELAGHSGGKRSDVIG
jgi:hypothetical protein